MQDEIVNNNQNIKEEKLNSDFSLLELGKNLVKNSLRRMDEKNLIIIGNKMSGKSSIFNNILMSNLQKENYTPTCGINYSFMRFQPSSNKKYILNIYEVGGGIQNLNLIRTIINEKNIKNTIFLLNLDFSIPNGVLKSLKDYLKELNQIIKEMFDQDTLMEIIENKRLKYKDINSNDFKRINMFPAEIIVTGNKYDHLEKIDAEKIKWTCRTLRYFCHSNAISLLYFKSGESKLTKILNGLITSIAFNVNSENFQNFSQKNDILPLYILYSMDSLIEIGDPKVIQQGSRDLASLWEDTINSVFPEDKNTNKENLNELENFEEILKQKYREPRIDEELQIFE